MANEPDPQEVAKYEHRAPGWEIRCTRCGLREPYGKYGVRMGAWSYGKYTVGWCRRCRRIRCHAIYYRSKD